MYINKNDFREFTDPTKAHEWGIKNYRDWITRLKSELPQSKEATSSIIQSYVLAEHDGGVSDLLFGYTGSNNSLYNRLLYGNDLLDDFDDDEKKQLYREIETIDAELNKLSTPENIVVYRFTHKELFKCHFAVGKIVMGEVFQHLGFASTTLVAESLLDFAKNNHYNCVLKIYLPKGTKGAYICQDDGLHEQEFLLPTKATLKLIRKSIWARKLMKLYECLLVSQ